jgi:glutamate carboxypeptidase
MQEVSTEHKQVQYLLSQNYSLMIAQLHQWCEINTGTENLDGLTTMREALIDAFNPLADQIDTIEPSEVRRIDMLGNTIIESFGEHLFFRKRPELRRRVLLVGHMDTVYPKEDPFQTLTYLNDNCLQGPGVTDMKGGLVILLHALEAFEQTQASSQIGWDVFINSDEEVGSPSSRPFLERIAKDYEVALVYEPATTPEGLLAKNRKGVGKGTLIARGRAAHAGRAFEQGRNAIAYLAEAIVAIHALNGKREGVTINIGKVLGGTAVNVVPETAVVKLDMRISTPEDEAWLREALEKVVHQLERKDYSLVLDVHFDRPVKRVNEATEHLFQRIKSTGEALNLEINWQDSGGCCDGNNLAKQGRPTLATIDSLGARGGNIHSSQEFILLDSLVERACLSAWLLMDIAISGRGL